jgi:uncharacterized protein YecE (DUF72 family)
MPDRVRIGTAGWTIPRQVAECFPTGGSSLTRYSSVFDAAEINSTFRRSHKSQTFARWAACTPQAFRFAVKMPKRISHELRLVGTEELVSSFADETRNLGTKLGPWLLQLPPSLSYDRTVADAFFKTVRAYIPHALVCEPRHPTWFDGEADKLLASYSIARAAADPARVPNAATPGGASHLVYYRLHGAPRMYYSPYESDFLSRLAADIVEADAREIWCIFDNTASGAAAGNALGLKQRIQLLLGAAARTLDREME